MVSASWGGGHHQPNHGVQARLPASARASLPLPAAPDAQRSALYTFWGQSPVCLQLLQCAFTHHREERGDEQLGRGRARGVPEA
jgi:hypothetical protein